MASRSAKIKISFPYLQKFCLPLADKSDEGRCLRKPIRGGWGRLARALPFDARGVTAIIKGQEARTLI